MKRSNNYGITLIALVVTIVVLLILAGITIRLVFSNDGIISKAREAKNATENSELSDRQALNDLDNLIRDIDSAIDEIQDKEYMKDHIDSLNYIKYDLENQLEEVSEKLEEENKREERQQENDYWKEAI